MTDYHAQHEGSLRDLARFALPSRPLRWAGSGEVAGGVVGSLGTHAVGHAYPSRRQILMAPQDLVHWGRYVGLPVVPGSQCLAGAAWQNTGTAGKAPWLSMRHPCGVTLAILPGARNT